MRFGETGRSSTTIAVLKFLNIYFTDVTCIELHYISPEANGALVLLLVSHRLLQYMNQLRRRVLRHWPPPAAGASPPSSSAAPPSPPASAAAARSCAAGGGVHCCDPTQHSQHNHKFNRNNTYTLPHDLLRMINLWTSQWAYKNDAIERCRAYTNLLGNSKVYKKIVRPKDTALKGLKPYSTCPHILFFPSNALTSSEVHPPRYLHLSMWLFKN